MCPVPLHALGAERYETVMPERSETVMPERSETVMPNAVKPDFQCVRTHWIRGFIAFQRGSGGRAGR